jgi:predicted PolB exonuclease-like 3'-5' exonuclease
MINLYIDIETIPAQRPDLIAEIRASQEAKLNDAIASLSAPGNYGAEAAAKYIANKAEAMRASFDADVDEAYRKTGLDGSFGQICVIGLAVDSGPIITVHSLDESDVLRRYNTILSSMIQEHEQFNVCVIGHNVALFDLRFLMHRHIVNRIKPHFITVRSASAKPWESDKVYDTMIQWAGTGSKVSLDKLCKALSIDSPKSDITGATVWDAVKAGRLEDVAEYCGHDVDATRQVHQRMTFQS